MTFCEYMLLILIERITKLILVKFIKLSIKKEYCTIFFFLSTKVTKIELIQELTHYTYNTIHIKLYLQCTSMYL